MLTSKRQKLFAKLIGVTLLLVTGAVSATHLYTYWSSRTSEEYPPITSSNRYLIDAMYCSGGYCDNIYFRNKRTYRNYDHNYWTSFFSEEGTNYRTCGASNSFMTGVACKGSNCDNVSIQCTNLINSSRSSCYWTAYFSEEEGYKYLPSGYYAAGLRCRGAYCDNKSIYACRLL